MEVCCAGCGKPAPLGEGCDATLVQCSNECYVHTWCIMCDKPTKLRRAPIEGEVSKTKCVCLSAKVKGEAYKVLWETVRGKLKASIDAEDPKEWRAVELALQAVVTASPDGADNPHNNDEWVVKITRRGALFMLERLQARMAQEKEKKFQEQRLESRELTMLVAVAEEMGWAIDHIETLRESTWMLVERLAPPSLLTARDPVAEARQGGLHDGTGGEYWSEYCSGDGVSQSGE